MKSSTSIKAVALSVALFCTASFAQQTATAYKASGIAVDGNLSETCWQTATKLILAHDVGMMLTDGQIDSREDGSAEFVLLWDDEAFYCGSWRKDDIHNSPWTPQPGMVNQSWKDDGHEWWISFDFNDVWEDASPLYFGQFGWLIWKGFVWDNGAVSDLYVAYRNDNGPTNTTTDDLKEQGFYAPYSSVDGIDFQCELQIKWSSFLLGSMSTPSQGKELGFNLGMPDNDGGDMAAAWLRWAEGNHNTYQGWGKVTVGPSLPSANPAIGLNKTKLIFAAPAGGSSPSPQAVSVSNIGGGTLNPVSAIISFFQGSGWLTITPGGSGNSQSLQNSISVSGLAAGNYSSSVKVSAANAANSPSYQVQLAVVDPSAPSVSVTAPTSGAQWAAGSRHNITWNATHPNGVVSRVILVSRDGGAAWSRLDSAAGNTGTWSWKLPNSGLSDSCKIGVRAYSLVGVPGWGESEGLFKVIDTIPPKVAVVSPNGGEAWGGESKQDIRWTVTDNDSIDSVEVYLRIGNGSVWSYLHGIKGNPGKWEWTLPDLDTLLCWIRVKAFDKAGNAGTDQSNSPFKISGKPRFTSPESLGTTTGSNFGTRIRYKVPDGTMGHFRVTKKPDWITSVTDTLWGKAPDSAVVDTVVALLIAGGTMDSLVLKIHVVKGIGIVVEKASRVPTRLAVHIVRSAKRSPEFIVMLPSNGDFGFRLYNVAGRLVWSKLVGSAPAGIHRIQPDMGTLGKGVYLAKLQHGGNTLSRRYVWGE